MHKSDSITVLFAAKPQAWGAYEAPLRAALAEVHVDARLTTTAAPEQVDYVVYAPNGPLRDFSPFTRCKAVLNLWAGVEDVVNNPTLTQPLTRMVDGGLRQGMVEWVAGHVLRHHLGIDRHILGQDGTWQPEAPPLAGDRPLSVLGLGDLGQAVAAALVSLGFPVSGWSRSPKTLADVTCYHGQSGLRSALSTAQIVVLLLPLTGETENVINAQSLSWMPQGAVLINPGRGALIDDQAVLDALDRGHLGHATLDVFRHEPLPPAHRFWSHPKVTVTPHIASETRPATASRVIAENVRRSEAGEPLLHLVHRQRGY